MGLFYRNKIDDRKLYLYIKNLTDEFTKEENTKEHLHTNDTNKAESINNSFVTMLYPKNRHLCRTINGFGRIAEVVLLDSIGFQATMDGIFDKLGIQQTPETSMYLQERDKRHNYLSQHKKKMSVKRKRAEDKQCQMREGKQKLLEDQLRGLEYASGIAKRLKSGEKGNMWARKLTKKNPGVTCQSCGLVGHGRFTSKRCPLHDDYKYSILPFLKRYEESGESWELASTSQIIRSTLTYAEIYRVRMRKKPRNYARTA